jgi:hypothetical protein
MRSTTSSPGALQTQAGVLVRYRVFGGPVSVDQRLTVFEDGAVQLDERHRSRDPIWLQIDAAELEELRVALEELPAERWSNPARLALTRIRSLFILSRIPVLPSGADFQLRRGRRAILGEEIEESDVAALVDLLDALRVRAVCAVPR